MTLPPKNVVFRISRRKIILYSPDGDGFCLGKIRGRVMTRPYDSFFNMTKRTPPFGGVLGAM